MPLLAPMTDPRRFAVVILAAGQGTRMRSDTHKVLYPIACRPLLMHLLDSVDRLGAEKRVVVVGKGRDQVEKALSGRDVQIAHQVEQKGTAHAVQQAKDALAGYDGAVLILYGDTPFVEAESLKRMLDRLDGDGGPGVRRGPIVPAVSPARTARARLPERAANSGRSSPPGRARSQARRARGRRRRRRRGRSPR